MKPEYRKEWRDCENCNGSGVMQWDDYGLKNMSYDFRGWTLKDFREFKKQRRIECGCCAGKGGEEVEVVYAVPE